MSWIIEQEGSKYALYDRIGLTGVYTDEELYKLYIALIDAGIVTKAQQAMDRRTAQKQQNGEREEEIIVYPITSQEVL